MTNWPLKLLSIYMYQCVIPSMHQLRDQIRNNQHRIVVVSFKIFFCECTLHFMTKTFTWLQMTCIWLTRGCHMTQNWLTLDHKIIESCLIIVVKVSDVTQVSHCVIWRCYEILSSVFYKNWWWNSVQERSRSSVYIQKPICIMIIKIAYSIDVVL